jgi:hypothetical protein
MSVHAQRVQAVRDMFAQANDTLASEVDTLDRATAVRNPAPDSWNAAQLAHHVALTNGFLSGAISGSIAEVMKPRPADFQETLASMDLSAPIETFSILEPPEDADPGDAVSRLRESQDIFFNALDTVSEERCGAECIELPFGLFSLYEVAEFAAAHVVRHTGQMRRAVES